jgi:hypothetical protein
MNRSSQPLTALYIPIYEFVNSQAQSERMHVVSSEDCKTQYSEDKRSGYRRAAPALDRS